MIDNIKKEAHERLRRDLTVKTRTDTIRIPVYVIVSYETNQELEGKLEELENQLENVEYVIGVGIDDAEVMS